jgi:predicted transcriptional regulator
MNVLTVKIPDKLLNRLQELAQAQKLSLDEIVVEALENYADEDEATKEEVLQTMRDSLKAALAGEGQDAFEALAELRDELANDAE